MTSTRKGYVLILLSTVFAAIGYLGFEGIFIFYPSTSELNLLFWGLLGASIITTPYILRSQRSRQQLVGSISRHQIAFTAVTLLLAIGFIIWLHAIRLIGSGPLTLISKGQTILAFALGVAFLGERMNLREITSMLIVLGGIYLVSTISGETTSLGVLLALGFAITQAIQSFVLKKWAPELHGISFAYAASIVITIIAGVLAFVTGELTPLPLTMLGIITINQLLGIILGRALYFEAHKHLPISTLNILILSGPVLILSGSYLLFATPISGQKILGASLILGGLIFFTYEQFRIEKGKRATQAAENQPL